MDRYLTKKSQSPAWWEGPLAGVSGFLTAIGVWVIATDQNPAEPLIQILSAIVFLGTLSAPLLLTLQRWNQRRQAKAVAKCLANCRDSTLTFGALGRRAHIPFPEKTLQKLVSKGFLQNIPLDLKRGLIRLDNGFDGPKPQTSAPVQDTGNESFNEKLRQIRDLNDRIAHDEVSRKIDRIEALTGDIFQLVAQNPGRAADARKFINYYLPTTLKLLEAYSLMEKQRYQGESITASRKQIEDALDKLIRAIERQQDRLFQSDALDVETDIEVLETMMASDGLIRSEIEQQLSNPR